MNGSHVVIVSNLMIIEEMIYSRPGDKIPTQRKDSKLERNCIQLMEGKIEIEYE